MRRLWLLFSQFVTVLLALWFVVLTLKPQWPQDWQSLWQKWRSPAISLNTKGQSTAPLAQPVVGQSMSFRDAVRVAAPSVVSISTSRAADDPAAAKDPWFRFFFGEQGENAEAIRRDIAGILHTLNQAYDNLYDKLLSDMALDVSSEIAALQGMLANDGLAGEEMR